MNANELAERLERFFINNKNSAVIDYAVMQATTSMLRQLQADYYSLLFNYGKLYAKVVEKQSEIEILKRQLKWEREEVERVSVIQMKYAEKIERQQVEIEALKEKIEYLEIGDGKDN